MGDYVISPGPRFAEIVPRGTPPAVFLADKRLFKYMRVRIWRVVYMYHNSCP